MSVFLIVVGGNIYVSLIFTTLGPIFHFLLVKDTVKTACEIKISKLKEVIETANQYTNPIQKLFCSHERVEQYWLCQGILYRKCEKCKLKEEWDMHKSFNKLWSPKFINAEPIQGLELEKMLLHKESLNNPT